MTKAAQIADAPVTATEVMTLLSKKTQAPAGTPDDILREGAALLLTKAGKALAPQALKASRVAASLKTIDALVDLDGEIATTWLMLRAMNLPAGAQIGCTDEDLANPIFEAFISAAGYIATTDLDATVRAVYGEPGARPLDSMVSGARIVKISVDGALSVEVETGRLFAVDLADLDAAIATIDSRAVAAKSDVISEISYNAVETAGLAEFASTVFAPYKVRRVEIPGAQDHPTALVESAALASVLPPVPHYKPYFHSEIISKGVLSDVQMEAVIYAGEAHSKYLPHHPDDSKKIAPRQGFLVGHGTGVGKGRITAAIIADNWAQGRRRHIWFSESARLIADAKRDWIALGGRAEDIIDLRDLPAGEPIPPMSGIIFSTYAGLRSTTENSSRLKQLIDWFGHGEDGVIAFDEAQNLRNAKGDGKTDGWTNQLSLQGVAALELQDALPNARVTYVSATSASDIVSLGFAIRLGLWGEGTAFPTAKRFFEAMEKGGTNALEMVARDLKAMGLYLAANLSFIGVKYERLHRKLDQSEKDAQDRLAELWLNVGDGLKRALMTTGASRLPVTTKGRTHKLGTIHFMQARARFFQALMASLNTPQTIAAMQEDIAAGHAPVIQLTNTFAANLERAIEDAEGAGEDIDTIEATPRDILLGYLKNQFPVYKYHAVRRNRKIISQVMLDANGDPMTCPQAVAVRDQLIQDVMAVPVPEGPLEQIMKAFGPDMIAEVTGRSRRIVPGANGGQELEERSAQDIAEDLKAFVDNRKQILIFSTAGATGATYSAQRTFRNQRLRRHYVLQAGWRADLALQGMGRSHRSDQVQPPEYVLVSTDLWANQRMVSAVAKGMRDLGALTRGLRQAASQDFFTQDDNLEDEFSSEAWFNFVRRMAAGHYPNLSIGQFEREAGIPLRERNGLLLRRLPPVKRFLNAMSAMSCASQALFGQFFREELTELKIAAIESGDFDRGIETITPDSLIKLEDQVVYRDPRTGGETRLLKMLRIDELEPISYDDARRRALARGNTRVVKSLLTGRIAILGFPRSGGRISGDDTVEVIMPSGSRLRTRDQVVQERWLRVETQIAEQLWNAELNERGEEEEQEFWVITGAMLPIWDKLPRDRSTVFRMETDEGEQVIGRLVSDDFVSKLMKRVDALTGGGLPQDDVEATLKAGGVCSLANGWVLQSRLMRSNGKISILLQMPAEDAQPYAGMIAQAQMSKTIGALTTVAYFKLPVDDAGLARALGVILAQAPAVGAVTL